MSDPIPFLTSLSQALATMGLYTEGHPARDRALRASYQTLALLLEQDGDARFSFLAGEVVLGNRVLRELKEWEWARRLESIGVERLEFIPPVPWDEYEQFIRQAYEQLRREHGVALLEPHHAPTGVRYGRLALGGERLEELAAQPVATMVPFSLEEEIEAVQWLHDEAAANKELPLIEADTVVRSLALAMHQQGQVVLPLLLLKEFDQYTTTHSCNVSVLAMGMGEYLGFAPREVKALGVAALLHDIGKVKLPSEVLRKTGTYTAEERKIVEQHPVEGAQLILARHRNMDLAAVVAYEHHMRYDGGGYPARVFPREAHFASRLVQVCDVYDALVSRRPYREAYSLDSALGILEEDTGSMFDPELVLAFTTMLHHARSKWVSIAEPTVEVTGMLVPK
jgi:putative nucleotidyltransferase with HDIG domain